MSDYLLTGIGRRIKQVRSEKGLKLTELAENAGISKGLLSKIENGRTVPSLPVLLSVIKALQMVPEDFFKNMSYEPPRRYIHKSAAEIIPIQKEEEAVGFNYQHILEQAFENFTVEAVILEILPNSKREKVSVDAYEFKYVLKGEINYQIDDEFILLQEGDTLLYDGRIPHVPHNNTKQPAKMLVLYLYYHSENGEKTK
ncbi:MAG: helix-turn-helix transcriptional regulator [Saprospiraceae bacterium]|nr:helix-turn-helix transcriptional regulator [Saprospiraceae bacterium]